MTIIVTCINALISLLGSAISLVFVILPSTPFNLLNNPVVSKYFGYINYFVPVSEMVLVLEIWITAVAIYQVAQIVLRWGKVVD